MDKKLVIVSGSQAARITSMVAKYDAWDYVDVVIVQDDDFNHSCEVLHANMSATKQMVAILPQDST